MKISTRRGAILVCTLALNVFFMLSPIGSVTLGARRCQQECDGEQAACYGNCSSDYTEGTDEYYGCRRSCQNYWQQCTQSAITCYSENPDPHCYDCTTWCEVQVDDTCVQWAQDCYEVGYSNFCLFY